MQLVLSSNRIIAHGENFLSMGGVVINTVTGARYENATIAECSGCPSDIDKVGYEYHAGVFVPCAPYGVGNNNGFFMEVCETCATPRSSGIPIIGGLGFENLNDELKERLNSSLITLLWSNGSTGVFEAQTVTLKSSDWDFLIIQPRNGGATIITYSGTMVENSHYSSYMIAAEREVSAEGANVTFGTCHIASLYETDSITLSNSTVYCIPQRIYGVKL